MEPRLIVGLGNPGEKYAGTRHNIGFMAVDALADAERVEWKEGFKGVYGSVNTVSGKVYFLKPMTFMNLSGESVGELARYYKIEPEDIMVVYDDLDMEFGKIKFRKKGSSGGHNGIKSIAAHLGTDAFPRLKMGILNDRKGDAAKFVLAGFLPEEREVLKDFVVLAKNAVSAYLNDGLKLAMNKFNNNSVIRKEEV